MAKMFTLKQLRKMDKGDAYRAFLQELPDVVQHYFRNCVTKKAELDVLHEKLSSMKGYARFVKHACKVEESNPFPDGYSYILIDFIKKQALGKDPADLDNGLDEVLTIYSNAVEKMNKGRQKKMAKDLDLPKALALELAVIYPGDVLSKHNAWVFVRELSYRLSQLQKTYCPVIKEAEQAEAEGADKKTTAKKVEEPKKETPVPVDPSLQFDFSKPKFIKKLFKGFFGDDEAVLEKVYENLMLDKLVVTTHYNENQKRLWDAVTQYLLKSLEKQDVKFIKRVIDYYVKRRNFEKSRDTDVARRVSLADVSYEEFPKIATVINPDKYSMSKLLKAEKKAKKKKGKKKK